MLVAAGHTNRQIGRALGISEKTAEIHVHNIRERLNAPSRTGIATWVAHRGRLARRLPTSVAGLGASTILMAEQYPSTQLAGYDYHDGSIELARKRAADAGVAERITFDVASAQDFPGTGYDLVATFDCLHDMGDPLAPPRISGNRWTGPG